MAFNQAGNKILLIKKYFAKWKGIFLKKPEVDMNNLR